MTGPFIDSYSLIGALISAGLVTLFVIYAIYGECYAQYYKLKNRIDKWRGHR
jgi:hypothetical protein